MLSLPFQRFYAGVLLQNIVERAGKACRCGAGIVFEQPQAAHTIGVRFDEATEAVFAVHTNDFITLFFNRFYREVI